MLDISLRHKTATGETRDYNTRDYNNSCKVKDHLLDEEMTVEQVLHFFN